ncbi:MAG: acetyl-CoA carboxylase carboxyl transferase subunit alpha [Campylobacterales bacterium]|jgi:acetyl-CoA carboxylase carboxyl transferase subunit alpha
MASLPFEKRIEELKRDIEVAKLGQDQPAVEEKMRELEREIKKVFSSLTPYQKLQLARHPDRPHAIDIIVRIMEERYELHGDRQFRDDPAIVTFIGRIGGMEAVVIGEEKGRDTKDKLKRNFGMPHPEGYRKALRIAKLAEKFKLPILFLIDTAGAFPGIEAEERGQSEAIARNLFELSRLKVPTVAVVIGEGGSGGALALGVVDKFAMLKYSVFSVISPEGCAAILWGDNSKVEEATNALKISAEELKKLGLIDDIIEEPKEGAHRNYDFTAKKIKEYFLAQIRELSQLSINELLQRRFEKYLNYGVYKG